MKILNKYFEKGFETKYENFDIFVEDIHLCASGANSNKDEDYNFVYVLLDENELEKFIKDVELNMHRMAGGRSMDTSRVMMNLLVMDRNVRFKLLNQIFNTFPNKDEFSEEYKKSRFNA